MLRILGKIWRGWIRFATVLGNVQMVLLLSLVYWTIVAVTAIPMRLLSDPLALRRSNRGWVKRQPNAATLESMKRQG